MGTPTFAPPPEVAGAKTADEAKEFLEDAKAEVPIRSLVAVQTGGRVTGCRYHA